MTRGVSQNLFRGHMTNMFEQVQGKRSKCGFSENGTWALKTALQKIFLDCDTERLLLAVETFLEVRHTRCDNLSGLK